MLPDPGVQQWTVPGNTSPHLPALHPIIVTVNMKRTLQVFYWISGDPPFDSYELTLYAEDGEHLPTASAIQKTMVATNDRLAGKYLRIWKVGPNIKI